MKFATLSTAFCLIATIAASPLSLSRRTTLTCPPFSNLSSDGSHCICTGLHAHWSGSSFGCICNDELSEGAVFNSATGDCGCKAGWSFNDPSSGSAICVIQCPKGLQPMGNVCACMDNTMTLSADGKTCTCPSGRTFSTSLNKCVPQCPPHSSLSSDGTHCICSGLHAHWSGSSFGCICNDEISEMAVYNSATGDCSCKAGWKWYDASSSGSVCEINCGAGMTAMGGNYCQCSDTNAKPSADNSKCVCNSGYKMTGGKCLKSSTIAISDN